MTDFLPGVSLETFVEKHWRQRPLFVKDGARGLLDFQLDTSALGKIIAALDSSQISRSDDGVIFGQQIDAQSPLLHAAAQRLGRLLDVSDSYFDGVLTADRGQSIGCHYDDSDNFVLQQEGVKEWRLHSPDIIPAEERRLRLIKRPGIGNMHMPPTGDIYRLEPGDLLYIPLTWIHWGTAEGASTSISWVCPSHSPFTALWPLLQRELEHDPAWFEPWPRATTGLDDLTDRVRELLEGLTRPPLVERLLSGMRSPAPTTPAKPRAPDGLKLDVARVKAMVEVPRPAFELGHLVLPRRDGLANGLQSHLGRIYLRRFCLSLSKAWPHLSDEALRSSVQATASTLFRLEDARLLASMARPEITAFVSTLNEALSFGHGARIEAIVSHLGTLMLPWLRAAGVLEGSAILLMPSRPEALHLTATGQQLLFARHTAGRVWAQKSAAGELRLEDDEGPVPTREVPLDLLGETLVCLRRDAWYEAFYPEDERQRSSAVWHDIDDGAWSAFQRTLAAGVELITQNWPEAWAEMKTFVAALLPLHPEGLSPHNASLQAYRGVIGIAARPTYLAAQSLVHETGHNKLNTVLEIYRLYENSEDELYHSPFVDAERPLSALVHGIFSFLQDLHVTQRLIGRVEQVAHLSMEKYTFDVAARVKQALRTVQHNCQLTQDGQSLVRGFHEALQPFL